MSWSDFRKNNLWPVLLGLLAAVLSALQTIMTAEGFNVSLEQVGWLVLWTVVGYVYTIATRYGGSQEKWVQPTAPTDEVVFPTR